MGCCNNIETDDFEKIDKGYDSLIKSVQKEMESYQNKLKNLKKDSSIEDINHKYDQTILSILHNENSYLNSGFLFLFLSSNYLNNAQQCLRNEYVLSKLNPGVVIKLKEIEKQRADEINELKNYNEENMEEVNELLRKIEVCKNQIRTYEKEKEAAIIAKREEIRNNLLNRNLNNGVLPLYGERRGFNQGVDNKIVNQIHNDYRNN